MINWSRSRPLFLSIPFIGPLVHQRALEILLLQMDQNWTSFYDFHAKNETFLKFVSPNAMLVLVLKFFFAEMLDTRLILLVCILNFSLPQLFEGSITLSIG